MRKAILAAAAALTLAMSPAQASERGSAHLDVGAGRISWFDITTRNMAQAKEFYAKLFDWTYLSLEGTEYAAEIVSRGRSIGTLRVAEGPISGYNGVVYVQVDDVQASCEKAKSLGGSVVPGFPFNLTNRPGAIGLVLDPSGHPVGVYSKKAIPAEKAEGK
jgi:predicted enzyme related to lactoylglutathione lyase